MIKVNKKTVKVREPAGPTSPAVPDPYKGVAIVEGPQGVGIARIVQDQPGSIKIHLTDESCHPIALPAGKPGKQGQKGERGFQGLKGDDGAGIERITQDQPDRMVIHLSDGSSYQVMLPKGEDGRDIELGRSQTHLQWRYAGEEWRDLVPLSLLRAESASAGAGPLKLKLAKLSDIRLEGLAHGQILAWDAAREKWVNVAAGAGSGHTIQADGTPLTPRTNLNFIGAGVSVSDDAGSDATIITIPGGGDSAPLPGTVTRDSAGLIETVSLTGGKTYTFTRDGAGRIETIDDGTYLRSFTRDGDGRIASWTVT